MDKRMRRSDEDFSFSCLPSTRRKQFFDCLKNRWLLFLEVGLLLAFSSLLLVGLLFAEDLVTYNIFNDETMEETAKTGLLSAMDLTFASLIAVAILIVVLPLGGILRIYRSLIYDEGVFFFSDFGKGFKGTWKLCLMLGIVLGASYFACAFYKKMITVPILSYIPYGLLLFLVLPWALTALSYGSIYSSSFGVSLQNGFVLTVKSYWKALLCVLAFAAPLFLLFIPSMAFRYIAFIACFVFYYPLVLFAFYLVDIACFDEQINGKLGNGLYHKGLYDENINADE